MRQDMALYRHDFAICPWCDGQSGSRVDHLYDGAPQQAGPWYCDRCGKSFRVSVRGPGDVLVTKDETGRQSFTRSVALLKFNGVDAPVFFIMDRARYRDGSPESDEDNQHHQRYFFEEHSCPTNWLRDCVCVIKENDCDPHGFLEFVRAVDVPQDFDADDDDQWPMLFPEAFSGTTIEGEAVRISGALSQPARDA